MQAAIAELQEMVRREYPDVRFRVYRRSEAAVFIEAITPENHTLEIMNLISERELEMTVDEGIEVHVLPMFETLATRTSA